MLLASKKNVNLMMVSVKGACSDDPANLAEGGVGSAA